MAKYQISWKAATYEVNVQLAEDSLEAGFIKLGEFDHHAINDPLGPEVNHVIWHHVRDALYHQGVLDMQRVVIHLDEAVATAVTGVAFTSPDAITINNGETYQLAWTVSPSTAVNKAVTFVSIDPTKVTVSNTGLVTGVAAGYSTVQIKTVDGEHVDSLAVTSQVPVAQSVSVAPKTFNLKVGETQQLTSTVLPANTTDKTVTYASYDATIASVSNTGLVTALKTGVCGIQVSTANGHTDAATATITAA